MTNHRRRRSPRFVAGLDRLERRDLAAVDPAAEIGRPIDRAATVRVATLADAAVERARHGVDGRGLAVAVIDTGVDYRHAAFGGGFGPGRAVRAGYDFGDGDADPRATTWPHGTAVAGLIAGREAGHLGVAPGAEVVALRVFGDDNASDYGRLADALQWVVAHHREHGISAVNLSLSDGENYGPGDPPTGPIVDRIVGLIRELNRLDIPVIAAAGNAYDGRPGMGFAAIVPETISVTSVDADGRLASDAQRLGRSAGGPLATDLAATGVGLVAPLAPGRYAEVGGTSFAAPVVTGSVLLLQQLYKSRFGRLPAVAELESWLEGGGSVAIDPATGDSFRRLDLARSLDLVPTAPVVPTTPVRPAATAPAAPVAASHRPANARALLLAQRRAALAARQAAALARRRLPPAAPVRYNP